ncbi:MAG: GrpB family protein [Spirochaetota bacterium]
MKAVSKQQKQRIEELVREEIAIVPYDPAWPGMFHAEAAFLRSRLPSNIIRRIEHFGSTAVPGLAAKPVIDMLIEVAGLDETKKHVVPLLQAEGYEYFWRPSFGDDVPPWYAWFIKRNTHGTRTHHLHMVEAGWDIWDRLYFRDYLREFPGVAEEYEKLKMTLASAHPRDRVTYTAQKTYFIVSVTKKAKEYFNSRKDK